MTGKPRRLWRRKSAAIAAAAVVLALLVPLLPPVQTALVRALVGGADGVEIDLDRVWAGPWGASVSGLRLVTRQVEVLVQRADVDLALWSSLTGLRVEVEGVEATGVELRLGPFLHEERPELEAKPFRGLGPIARLPARLVVRHAAADGVLEVSVAEELDVVGRWAVRATDLGPGQTGRVEVSTALDGRRSGEVVLEAEVAGSATLRFDGDGALRSLGVGTSVRAAGGGRSDGLDSTVTIDIGAESEAYRLALEDALGNRLVGVEAELTPAAGSLAARWSAEVPPGLVASFASGRTVPDLWGRSSGSAALSLDTPRIEVEAAAEVEAREWSRIDARLVEVGGLTLGLDVAGSLDGGRLNARRLQVALTGDGDREILRLLALQPLSVDLEQWQVVPEAWGDPALRVEADRFPLRWTRGFDRAAVVEEGTLSGSLEVVPLAPRHSRLVAREALRVRRLLLRPAEDQKAAGPLDLLLEPQVEVDNGALRASIERAELAAATGLRVGFAGRAATSRDRWPVLSLEGEVALRAPALQRVVESLDAIEGAARFDLDLGRMTLALDTARLGASTAEGRPLVAVTLENESPLLLGLPSLRADWESMTPQRLRVRFDGLPIGWVSPFIPELDLPGGALHGDLVAGAGDGRGITLEAVEPFEVRGLDALYRGAPFATDAALSLEPRVRLDNRSVILALDSITVRTREGGRLDGEIALEALRDGRGRVHARLSLEGHSAVLAERFDSLGALRIRQTAEIDLPNRRLEVTDLDVALTDVEGTEFLKLSTLRPFLVGGDPLHIWVEDGPPDILVATVTPLELQRLVPELFGLRLEGVLPQGSFAGRVENGGLLLVAEDPLMFRDVSVRWDEAILLDRVTIGLRHEVFYSGDGLHARSIDLEALGPRGTPIADVDLRVVMPLTEESMISSLGCELDANLEPLSRQPIFEGLPTVVAGSLRGKLDLSFGELSRLAASLELRGARAQGFGTLPDLDAEVQLKAVEGQRLEVRAPLRLASAAGASDLAFEGFVAREGESTRFDAALTGDRFAVADLARFVDFLGLRRGDELASPAAPHPEKGALRPAVTAATQLRDRRDASPIWGRNVTGRARVDLGTLEVDGGTVTDLRGLLEVDPGRIELAGLGAEMAGARVGAAGALTFDPEAPAPYELLFNASVDNLDVGAVLRAVQPDAPPTLEGRFDLEMSLAGSGRNPLDLGLASLGGLRLTGRDGVFRGLAGRFGLARKGAGVVGFLTFSKELKAVSRLLGELEELRFDTFDLVLARTEPQRFEVSELSIASPLARIEGAGGVEVSPDRPLALSPLDARLTLETRGDLTVLFDGMGLLEPGADERGYRPLTRPVTVGGTVAEPDTSDFYALLDQAAANAGGSFGLGLRAINRKLQKSRTRPSED